METNNERIDNSFTYVDNEYTYLRSLNHLQYGGSKSDRTDTGTRSVFGKINNVFSLGSSKERVVPLLSTKKMFFKGILHELIWMLSGSGRVGYLKENGVNIWDEWVIPGTEVYKQRTLDELREEAAKKGIIDAFDRAVDELGLTEAAKVCELQHQKLVDGDLGPVYGVQWRKWEDTRYVRTTEIEPLLKRGFESIDHTPTHTILRRYIDQIAELEHTLKTNPDSRRMILSAWNVSRVDEMALPPCHTIAQWGVEYNDDHTPSLNCVLYQRSGDWFLGVPFNIVFYSVLTHMLSEVTGIEPGTFTHAVGDAHLYSNHITQAKEQLHRQVIPTSKPTITLPKKNSILDYVFDDITLHGYECLEAIKAPVAV